MEELELQERSQPLLQEERRTGYDDYDVEQLGSRPKPTPAGYRVPPATALEKQPVSELDYAGYTGFVHPLQRDSQIWKNLAFAAMGLALLCIALQATALGTTHWSQVPVKWVTTSNQCTFDAKLRFGLVKACNYVDVSCASSAASSYKQCFEREDYCDIEFPKADPGSPPPPPASGIDTDPFCQRTRAVISLVAIVLIVLVLAAFVSMFAGCGSRGAHIAASCLYSAAVILLIAALGVWGKNNSELDSHKHNLLTAFEAPPQSTQAEFQAAAKLANVELSWSFGLTVVVLCGITVANVLHIVAARKMRSAFSYGILGSPVALPVMA